MHDLTVSVIIVVKNGEKYMSEAIESVQHQTIPPDEIIVIDGQSTDKTDEIAKSYPGVTYVLQKGCGLADARNLGIQLAGGDLVAFLDHDDIWSENKLELQVQEFLDSPDIQYCYSKVKFFLEPGCELRYGYDMELLMNAQSGRTPGALVSRRSLFDEIGKFNGDFSIACDVDWFSRAMDYNIKAGFVPEVLLHKRLHQTNLSSDVQTNRKELFRVIKASIKRRYHLSRV